MMMTRASIVAFRFSLLTALSLGAVTLGGGGLAAGPPGPSAPGGTSATSSGGGLVLLRGGEGRACLLRDNQVRCWGRNLQGALGDGTQVNSDRAVPVEGLPKGKIIDLVTTNDVACVRYDNGDPWCWGAYNVPSQRGFLPTKLKGFESTVEMLALGQGHQCGLSPKGVVRCVGRNYSAELGYPRQMFSGIHDLPLPEPATAVFGLKDANCANLKSGKTVCWGTVKPGLFGARDTPCFAKGNRKGCTPKPLDAKLVKAPVVMIEYRGDVCALDAGGTVSWLISRVASENVATGVAELSFGDRLCVRMKDSTVRCATRRAEVCRDSNGRMRCRSTLGHKDGPDWDSALRPVPGLDDALSIGMWGDKVCAARASGAVTCHAFKRGKDSVETISFPSLEAIAKERKGRKDGLAQLKASTPKDLFAGSRWFVQRRGDNAMRDAERVRLGTALILAGRTAEGIEALRGQLSRVRSVFDSLVSEAACASAVAILQVPGDWKKRSLEPFVTRCAKHLTSPQAALARSALLKRLGDAPARTRPYYHQIAASFHALRGEMREAQSHASQAAMKRTRRDVVKALQLGVGAVHAQKVSEWAAFVDKTLPRLMNAPVSSARRGGPSRALKSVFETLTALAPAAGTLGISKKAMKRWRALAFKVLAKQSMDDLRRAELALGLLAATPPRAIKRSEAKKRLGVATKWANGGDLKTAGFGGKRTAEKLFRAHIAHGTSKGILKLSQRWVPTLSRQALVKLLSAAGRSKVALKVIAAEPGVYMQRPPNQVLLQEALLRRDCELVNTIAQSGLPLVEMEVSRIVTVSEQCPKLLVSVPGMAKTANENRVARGVILASQGKWREAMQASAQVNVTSRPSVWAYIAMFWERAGRPDLTHLAPVIDAVLE